MQKSCNFIKSGDWYKCKMLWDTMSDKRLNIKERKDLFGFDYKKHAKYLKYKRKRKERTNRINEM